MHSTWTIRTSRTFRIHWPSSLLRVGLFLRRRISTLASNLPKDSQPFKIGCGLEAGFKFGREDVLTVAGLGVARPLLAPTFRLKTFLEDCRFFTT